MKLLYINNTLEKYQSHSFLDLESINVFKKNEYIRENYCDLLEVYNYLFSEEYVVFSDFYNDINNIKNETIEDLFNEKERKHNLIVEKLLLTKEDKEVIDNKKREELIDDIISVGEYEKH